MRANKTGWVYVLTNPAFPHLVKIGCTGRAPEIRCRELAASTGVPAPFAVAWAARVADYRFCELLVHAKLDTLRANATREFFRCDVAMARILIEEAAEALLRPWWRRLATGWLPRRSGRPKSRRRGSADGLLTLALIIASTAAIIWLHPSAPSWMPPSVIHAVALLERLH
jgi:hypothetical protein